MKLIDLQNDVKRLMYVDELDDYEAFLYATNRAVFRTRSVFPKIKRKYIAIRNPENLLSLEKEEVIEVKKSAVFYAENVKAFYFEAEGEGKADFYRFNADKSVNDYELLFSVEIKSIGTFQSFKGFVKRFGEFVDGNFKVVFGGDFFLRIKNLALYDTLMSSSENDILAYKKIVEIDLEKATEGRFKDLGVDTTKGDFMSLNKPIIITHCGKEKEIPYTLSQKILYIDGNYSGELILDYIAMPNTVGVSSKDSDDIDIPKELETFVSYLIASNLLLEEESELSSQYISRYLEAENNAKSLLPIKSGVYEYTGEEF